MRIGQIEFFLRTYETQIRAFVIASAVVLLIATIATIIALWKRERKRH